MEAADRERRKHSSSGGAASFIDKLKVSAVCAHLGVSAVDTQRVSASSPAELLQPRRRGNGNSAHSLSAGSAASPPAVGRRHMPATKRGKREGVGCKNLVDCNGVNQEVKQSE